MFKEDDLIHSFNTHRFIKLMDDCDLNNESSDQDFDILLKLACYITKCSASYISFIAKDWQNVRYTLNNPKIELPLSTSICQFVLNKNDFLQINDITKDELTKILFSNQTPHLKFFAGIPLVNSKKKTIGTLCVLNEHIVDFDEQRKEAFKTLGVQVINTICLRKINAEKFKITNRTDEYNTLFNSSPDVICVLNDKAEISIINSSVLNILGYTVDECVGTNITSFVFLEDQKNVSKIAEQSLKNGSKTFEVETRIQTKSNEIKWVSWNAIAKDRKWFVIGREITKFKETLKNLNQLSIVASKINNGVIISDAKSNTLWVNKAFTEITGFELQDIQSKRWGDVIIGSDSDPQIIENARIETKNKKSFSVEFLAYTKHSKPIWLSVHNTIILDKKGEIENLVEIVIDISERKQTEEKLELLSLVASKTENGVAIFDKNGNVKWINEALKKIIGYSLEELEGKKISDFIKPVDQTKLLEARFKEQLFIPYTIELTVYRKDGKEVWLSISNTPIFNENGLINQQIKIISDITERKEAEFQLIAAREQALQLSKAKEMFLSVMSHEIRTPLNAVIGLSNILHDDAKLESQHQTINLLKFSADNLVNLINDILDFSKMEMGKMELENKRLNLKELVIDIVESLKFKTDTKNISINYQISDKLPELVRGDKTRLYQILINLINNAIKFTEEGSVDIILDVNEIDNDYTSVNFKVIDTGIGIPENKLDDIFESFTQAASNTARKYGGSGLGLSITKKLIELYQGSIYVNSELGKGSTFEFDIKFNNFKESNTIHTPALTNHIDAKILVVDDNQINRMLADKVLSKFGFRVVTTESGFEAIKLINNKDFDLILMDVHMPEMDGYQTTMQIRNMQDTYFKEIPIIALTASILKEDLSLIYKSGMDDAQIKPYKPEELLAKINKFLMK